MPRDNPFAVYIGRFQPVTVAHEYIVKEGLKHADKMIIVIGSYRTAKDPKNPFSLEQRVEMFKSVLSKEEQERIFFTGVRDCFYDDNKWLTSVQAIVSTVAKDAPVALLGSFKDQSSYYFKLFPQWNTILLDNYNNINATDVRNIMFQYPNFKWNDKVVDAKDWPGGLISKPVQSWIEKNFFNTEDFKNLKEGFDFIKKYKESWAVAPYPPVFVTVDAVVTKSGHVLVVKRKINPGIGLYALPGGYVKADELIETAALRELREETRIKIHPEELKKRIVDKEVFDYPNRSLRGRTITHAFHIDLGVGELPDISHSGGDDAGSAQWMSLSDVILNEDKFFEDHVSIINRFV